MWAIVDFLIWMWIVGILPTFFVLREQLTLDKRHSTKYALGDLWASLAWPVLWSHVVLYLYRERRKKGEKSS